MCEPASGGLSATRDLLKVASGKSRSVWDCVVAPSHSAPTLLASCTCSQVSTAAKLSTMLSVGRQAESSFPSCIDWDNLLACDVNAKCTQPQQRHNSTSWTLWLLLRLRHLLTKQKASSAKVRRPIKYMHMSVQALRYLTSTHFKCGAVNMSNVQL